MMIFNTYKKFKKEEDHIEWIAKHLHSHEEKDQMIALKLNSIKKKKQSNLISRSIDRLREPGKAEPPEAIGNGASPAPIIPVTLQIHHFHK